MTPEQIYAAKVLIMMAAALCFAVALSGCAGSIRDVSVCVIHPHDCN